MSDGGHEPPKEPHQIRASRNETLPGSQVDTNARAGSRVSTNHELEDIHSQRRFRPSPALYAFTYSALVALYGEKCALCDRKPPDVRLEIDHVDGKRETWKADKLSLKCVHHNRSKFLAGLPTFDSVIRERENLGNASWEAQRSVELGPTMRLELERLLREMGDAGKFLTVIQCQNRIAKICGCDQQTVARFIDRETTEEGDFMLSDRTVSDGRKKRTLQIINWKTRWDPDGVSSLPVSVVRRPED